MGQIGYLFNFIFTYPIFNLLMLLYHLIGDFGLSIIVLTLIVRFALFPLTFKSMKAMKATQAQQQELQPKMAEINKKYAKDKAAKNEAIQKLYQENGMNPFAAIGGCLPLLLQTPVFIGLYNALSNVIKGTATLYKPDGTGINNLIYPFLPHFSKPPIIDLSWFTFLNPAWHFSLSNPDPTHVLPILAALATFIQLRMSQQRTTAATTNPAAQQMKMMSYIFPVSILIFSWNVAGGVALYWTVSYIFSIFQQYFITGWGSLSTVPNLISSNGNKDNNSDGKSYTGDKSRENRLIQSASERENIVESGPIGSKLQSSSHMNGSSSARRRSPSNSASARRRSSNNVPKRNVPKRNPSRS